MYVSICISYGVLGLFVGALFAFLFIQMDEKWKTLTLTSVGLPIFIGILPLVNEYMNIDNSKIIFYLVSVIYIVCLLISFCIVLVITGYLIKQQTGITKIRFLDILLGYNKCFEKYYESREKEVNNELNYDTLVNLKNELDIQKQFNDHQKLLLIEKERVLNEQLENAIALSLPVSSKMPVDNKFLTRLPGYIANLTHFYHSLAYNTHEFCQKYETSKGNDLDFVLGYFSSICIDINTKLFDNSCNNIRSHFRIKYKDEYIKFIAFQGNSKFNNDLTKIPIDSGLIKHSFENRCSLLKSENRLLHHKSKNDGYWKNYLSFAICDVLEDDYPLLSVGISVNDEGLYNDMLYFINFCKIERLISKCIAQFNDTCNIYNVIESYCSQMENEENDK